MPHFDFDAARRAYEVDVDPVTFSYGGDTFTVLPDPTLGDTFDLADAPDLDGDFDPLNATHLKLVTVLAKFIRRMLPPEDRERFDRAHYRIPSTQAVIIIEIAQTIVSEVIAKRPTQPPGSSSSGRLSTGPGSKKRSATRNRSS